MSGRCKACGRAFRKGALAFVLGIGGLKLSRVCQRCAGAGALLVAPKGPVVVKKAHVRPDGVDRTLRILRTFAAAARAAAKDNKKTDFQGATHALGRAEGFEGAIETIKRECGGDQ